jgi:hypothetical protein
MHDDLTKDQFIEALGDGEIRWSVFQALPKNITEALKVAMELEAFKESEKSRLRKSVRGINVDNSGSFKMGPNCEGRSDEGTNSDLETSLQQLVAQVSQLRQVSGNVEFKKKEYQAGAPIGNGKWSKEVRQDGRTVRAPEPRGGQNMVEEDPNGEGRRYNRTYDMSKVKCFRCDQMGHFVRHCPGLPKWGGVSAKVEENLNE